MSATLVPGDRVLFGGQTWEVFITPIHETPESLISIFRYEAEGRACGVIDLLRLRSELTLIPRAAS